MIEDLFDGSIETGQTATDLFPVHVTAQLQTGGIWYYDWVEQSFNQATGVYSDAISPRTGTKTAGPFLVELNNQQVTTPCYGWARLRGMVNSKPYYEFTAGQVSSGLTTKDVTGVPTYTGVTVIQTDGAQGAYWTNPSGGVGQLNLYPADLTHTGTITIADQVIGGTKNFHDQVTFQNINAFRFHPYPNSTPNYEVDVSFGIGSYIDLDWAWLSAGGTAEVSSINWRYYPAGPGQLEEFDVYWNGPHAPARGTMRFASQYYPAGGDVITTLLISGGDTGLFSMPFMGMTISKTNGAYFQISDPTTGMLYGGGTAITGGMTFYGGLYISGTPTAGSITVGTTTIASGTNGYMLYNNGGVLGNTNVIDGGTW